MGVECTVGEHVTSPAVGEPVSNWVCAAVGLHDVLLLCQQAAEKQAPSASETVHGGGAQGVINTQL